MMSITRFIALAVLVALSSLEGCTDRSRQPHTAADGAPAIPTANPVKVKWEGYFAKGKFETHRRLVKVLREGTMPSSASLAFEILLAHEPERLERCLKWCAQAEGPPHVRADMLRLLYAELMLAKSDPDLLYEAAQFDIASAFRNAKKDPINYGQYFSWGLSRPLQACLIAYEATGEIRFLDLVADAYEATLPFRDSELQRVDVLRGRALHSWGTNSYGGEGRYTAEVTTAGRVSYPIVQWIQFIRKDPALTSKYGERAEKYLQTARQTMEEFTQEYRTVDGTNQGYFVHLPTGKAEPLNHMALAARCLAILSELTGEPQFMDKATGIASYFKASMWVDEDDCLVWQYWPQPHDPTCLPLEHVWKARVTIEVPLDFAQRGVVFDQQDMQRICNTFLTNIYQGQGKWNKYITSEYSDFDATAKEPSGLLCMTPFIRLDRYNPKVREVIEEMIATRPDCGGWLNRSHGLLGYAYRLHNPDFNNNRTAESLSYPQREY
jgi:hypothetical protein